MCYKFKPWCGWFRSRIITCLRRRWFSYDRTVLKTFVNGSYSLWTTVELLSGLCSTHTTVTPGPPPCNTTGRATPSNTCTDKVHEEHNQHNFEKHYLILKSSNTSTSLNQKTCNIVLSFQSINMINFLFQDKEFCLLTHIECYIDNEIHELDNMIKARVAIFVRKHSILTFQIIG